MTSYEKIATLPAMLPIAWQADCDVLLCVKSYKRLCLNRLNLRHRRSRQRDIRCLGTAVHKRLLPSIFLHFHPAVLGFQNIYRYILFASTGRAATQIDDNVVYVNQRLAVGNTITVEAASGALVFINGEAATSYTVTTTAKPVQIVVQNGDAEPYIVVLK